VNAVRITDGGIRRCCYPCTDVARTKMIFEGGIGDVVVRGLLDVMVVVEIVETVGRLGAGMVRMSVI
jgi:hypothetical protein